MKKLFILMTGIFMILTINLMAQHHGENIREKMKRIREIEKQTIENNTELKTLQQQIQDLQKQLRQKLDEKLQNDTEYQNLKTEMQQWKKQHQEWIKEKPMPPASKKEIKEKDYHKKAK